MKNKNVERQIKDCSKELFSIKKRIIKLSPLDSIIPYLTNYTLIRGCGTIEWAIKNLIYENICAANTSIQIKEYFSNNLLERAVNPQKENILKLINHFDAGWKNSFKNGLRAQANSSLKSLYDLRCEFAHGGNPRPSFPDVYRYYFVSIDAVVLLDNIIN
ncbi:MAG: hypothetical protein CVV21_11475 [Candidatus Goldiibacteriota bacterium HGW-Goldbacteria-1]|nr:MAG: hypothetical protein CVV21_11475 [Candidatus Goldiibacteriota bacterium HGW-Goldbacteria-1]